MNFKNDIKALKPLHPFLRPKSWWRRMMKWVDDLCAPILGTRPMYWLRTHTIHRYHIINLKGQAGYKWGYADPSFKLLVAPFKIFCDFIDEEQPFDVHIWDEAEEKEARALYDWWKTGRDAELDEEARLYEAYEAAERERWGERDFLAWLNDHEMNEWRKNHPAWKAWYEAHKAHPVRDDEMLARLYKIRQLLWT